MPASRTFLNDLPPIVTGPGEYVTRSGRRVTVRRVTAGEGDFTGATAFRVKGSVWRVYRGKSRPCGYSIWHVSGRAFPQSESKLDIVGVWEGEG